jgi:hypothetical protein
MKIKRVVLSRNGLLLVLAALLLYPITFTAAFAQEMPDVIGIRLNDGSVIEGTVIKANADEVTIQTKDGQIVTRKFSDVDNFIKTGESTKPTPKPSLNTLLPVHSFDIGLEAFYKEYKEPDVMNEKGMMYGLGLAYTYHDKVMFKASLLVAYGEVDYENSGKLDGIPDQHWELRALLGYDFAIDPTFYITPYFGLGYRFLRDDSSGMITTTGARGYNRESNYWYSPVGIALIKILPEGWTISAEAEFDYLWFGKQKSYLSDVSALLPDIENDQDQGYGLRASIRVEKKFVYTSFFVEPFVRYWNISRSDDTIVAGSGLFVYGYEPKNNTTEIGALVGFKF